MGGALDVARASLAADATPGAHPGGLNRLKLPVVLILNQSKAEKNKQKNRTCSLLLVLRVATGVFSLYVGVPCVFASCGSWLRSLCLHPVYIYKYLYAHMLLGCLGWTDILIASI